MRADSAKGGVQRERSWAVALLCAGCLAVIVVGDSVAALRARQDGQRVALAEARVLWAQVNGGRPIDPQRVRRINDARLFGELELACADGEFGAHLVLRRVAAASAEGQ